MKVKGKLLAALASIRDQAPMIIPTRAPPIFSEIDLAVLRATDPHDGPKNPSDDKYLHELLCLVSNTPGSIAFLARKLSYRLEATRSPTVALKALLLLHRLLRGGDRYLEQDLRNSVSSGDLRMDRLRWKVPEGDPLTSFVYRYSMFLEERMGWIINQAGNLEPPGVEQQQQQLQRLSKCQAFLDRVMDCRLQVGLLSCHAHGLAMSVILRESFRVYDSFSQGVEIVLADGGSAVLRLNKPERVLALDVVKRACTQTPRLLDFYEDCKRSIKTLDYPLVLVVTASHVQSIEKLAVSPSSGEEEKLYDNAPFTQRLKTKISTVWVGFGEDDDDDNDEGSDQILTEGESSGIIDESMELLGHKT